MRLRCIQRPATASPSTPTAPRFTALLHGTLHVTVLEAVGVSFRATGSAPKFFRKLVEDMEDFTGLGKGHTGIYMTMKLEELWIGRTRLLDEPVNPCWNESFRAYCAHTSGGITFSLMFDNFAGSTLIGKAHLTVDEILSGEEVDHWLEVRDEVHASCFSQGMSIHVKVQFDDTLKDPLWGQCVSSPDYPGVPYTYFPQRKGCKVTLYQDAHVSNSFVPRIPLVGGNLYKPPQCWEEIFLAIKKARYLIYIAGWSLNKDIALVRDRRQNGDHQSTLSNFLKLTQTNVSETLGELLRRKADEGVRVLMLISDDSRSSKTLPKSGSAITHGEETLQYFKDSAIQFVLCPCYSRNKNSLNHESQVSSAFTHNQKIIVVDSLLPGEVSSRGISSFIGGLDLCEGRYDTQDHSLFQTLETDRHKDFYQSCLRGASIEEGGPRLPWHDVHCKLEGPIAWDVLFNFEQRWRKQGGGENVLVDTQATLDVTPYSAMLPEDKETWNVQLFRSIHWDAVSGFASHPDKTHHVGLVRLKGNAVEQSIHNAYINAIRRAKNFIYIESECFIGVSSGWKNSNRKAEDVEALNLIPKELSLKIVNKIEAGERFAVYVVIPLWPEGVPEEASVQRVLDSQTRTIEMMYKDIASALHSKGLNVNPKDYLSFFSLANREVAVSNEYAPLQTPDASSGYLRAQRSRRFMVYVHSKMMIVDDEYIFIGSANITPRSMNGAGDSEIAMGAYQPNHVTKEEHKVARGEIHGFRMALWHEHLGMLDDAFYRPQTPECMHMVNELAEKHWDMYVSDSLEHNLPGHLLSYPISVTPDGDVVNLPGVEFFPDTKAPILGSRPASNLPTIATTCLLKWRRRGAGPSISGQVLD